MKLIIAGSRGFKVTTDELDAHLKQLELKPELIISGGACNGADDTAIKYARKMGIPLTIMRADWSTGRGAGMVRNRLMAEVGTDLLAFWDMYSSGTKNMIDNMKRLKKAVHIIQQNPNPKIEVAVLGEEQNKYTS